MNILRKYLAIVFFISRGLYVHSVVASEEDQIKFYYYSTESSYQQVNLTNPNSLNVRGDGPLYILVDGFLSNFKSSMSQKVKKGLIQHRPNRKVIIVDWSPLSGFHVLKIDKNTQIGQFMLVYNMVKSNVLVVGNAIANFLATLNSKNITQYHKVHLIGYSLGAHIAGITGMTVIEKLNGRITRITGLDPAAGFSMNNPKTRLDKSDAEFVDIYYTNRYVAGDMEHKVGHVDVYVNGGKTQPGCVSTTLINSTICNHSFSWKAWNKCLTETCEACPCHSSECQDCSGTCKNPVIVGIDTSLDLNGDYYLKIGPFPSWN